MSNRRFGSRFIPYLLHLLLPGLGHVLAKEYVFGLFVFLVTLLAVVLFFVSFLVAMPPLAEFVLLGLPVIFYVFTFSIWLELSASAVSRRSGPDVP